jgi:hypothetical protein
MRLFGGICILYFALEVSTAFAQVRQVDPQILTKPELEGEVTTVEVAARFVTTIRLPETVNSVVVGDPTEFQVEHSEREPKLVFVRATSTKPAQTNLMISTISGRQVSLLLVSGEESVPTERTRVDFLVRYEPGGGFLVAPSGFPFAMVGQTVPLPGTNQIPGNATQATQSDTPRDDVQKGSLDKLLDEQENAPLPTLYGERINEESAEADHVRAGVSRVIDEGEQVVVLFSVVNPTKRAILLMPPQVQLGGRTKSGKVVRHEKWTTAEQLPVLDFRLSRRRIGPGGRADGVVLFNRPPYKQSNEALLLQLADSGAVDRPALAPIGFGVSTLPEEKHGRGN